MQFGLGAGTKITIYRRNTMGGEQAIATPTVSFGDVEVKKVSNGFILRVGCKTFIAKTWEEASVGLSLYFKDPNAARKQYCEDERN